MDDSITAFLESINTLRIVFLKNPIEVRGLKKRPYHKHHNFKEEGGMVVKSQRLSIAALPRALNFNRFNFVKAHRKPLEDISGMERAIFRWERETPGEILKANRPGIGIELKFRHFCNDGEYAITIYRNTQLKSYGLYCV